MTTSHSISPHISSTLSSITPPPPPHVLLSGGAESNDSAEEQREIEARLLVDKLPDKTEKKIPEWLKPSLPRVPGYMSLVLGITEYEGCSVEYHCGKFLDKSDKSVFLQQPPEPREGTLEATIWKSTLGLLEHYDHLVYYNAMIVAAHPPPLYAKDPSVEKGWHPRVVAAFDSLFYDAGIPVKVLKNIVGDFFTNPDARIIALEIVARFGIEKKEGDVVPPEDKGDVVPPEDKGDVVPPEDKGDVVPPEDKGDVVLPEDKGDVPPDQPKIINTYAQVFNAEWARFMMKGSRNPADTLPELSYSRDFAEYARIKGFLEPAMEEAMKNKGLETPPFLYALPFVKQLRPVMLLKLLHSYLKMRNLLPEEELHRVDAFKIKRSVPCMLWIEEKQFAPKKASIDVDSSTRDALHAFRRGISRIISEHGGSQAWQAKAFRNGDLVAFFNEGLSSGMQRVLALVTLSHTLLYLRRLKASYGPSTVPFTVASIAKSADASERGCKELHAHANSIVELSLGIMCERYKNKYRDVSLPDLRSFVGGRASQFLFIKNRCSRSQEDESVGDGAFLKEDETEQGPSSSKRAKVDKT